MVGKFRAWICGVKLIFASLYAQEYILSLKNHAFQHIAADEQQNLYLLSPDKATLSKYFYASRYDSSLTIGGRNLSFKEGFVRPSELLIPDSKTVFLVDEMANDIKFLNTNLKVQRVWNLNQIQQGYQPFQIQTATLAPTGEMFIQNKFNSMIYRVNVFGEIDMEIGGNNYAEASITDFAKLACTKESFFVWVSSERKLYQFHRNGNFKKSYPFSIDFENIFSDSFHLLARTRKQVFWWGNDEEFHLLLEHANPILDAYLLNNQIFVLDSLGVARYSFKKSP